MSGHPTYQPRSAFMKWMERRLPIAGLIYSSFVVYPTPRNLNYWWTFGGILSFMLAVQIVTGVVLAMHYTPHVDMAFNSVEHIMRDVNYGWLLRYLHSNGASMFFVAEHMDIDRDEEHRGAVGVQIAQQPAIVHVAHDVLDGIERHVDMRRIVHHQHNAGDDLHAEHERQDRAEGPPVVQVLRGRIDHERGMDQSADRQACLEPLQEGVLRLIRRGPAHSIQSREMIALDQPMRILVSDTNS